MPAKKKITKRRQMTKKVKAALIGLGVVAGIALTQVGFVSAATADTNELPPGIQAVIEKFNLNKDEVVKVLEVDRASRQEEMKAKFEEKLATLVTEGKITQAQKDAIITKHNELESNKDSNNHEEMKTLHDEFQNWLTEQGIDDSLIRPAEKGEMRGKGLGPKRD